MLWLVIEEVCPKLIAAYIELFRKNYPTFRWFKKIMPRGSLLTMQLV